MLVDKIPVLTKSLMNEYFYIVLVLKALILVYPANYLVKTIMPKYEKNKEKDEAKNGRMIGTMLSTLITIIVYVF